MRQYLHLKKDRFLIFFFVFLAVLLVTLIGCLLALRYIAMFEVESADNQYASYILADQLRRSSDELTRMVRLYVVTENEQYLKNYKEILSIRNGETPRPLHYNDQIYWAFVTKYQRPRPYGKAISLEQEMINHGFTLHEFNLLEKSENESNVLTSLEIKAINAIQGKYENVQGEYVIKGKPDPKLARELVFGPEYMEMKRKVMAPIQTFLEEVEGRTKQQAAELRWWMFFVIAFAIALAVFSTVIMLISIVKTLKSLSKSNKDSELLLLNILPSPIAKRLKQGEETIADEYQASILFADIVKFTQLAHQLGAKKTVEDLNALFDRFDDICEKYGVEKIKTIGDSYMAVSGIPIQASDHAIRLADFALAMKDELAAFNKERDMQLQMRVGMNYGTVVAGVIGHKKFIYDIWGDVVNIASRMESTGVPGEIQLTEKMALLLEEEFVVEERAVIEVKGHGSMKTYFLKGRKDIEIY